MALAVAKQNHIRNNQNLFYEVLQWSKAYMVLEEKKKEEKTK